MAEATVSRVARLLDDFATDGQLWGFGGKFDKLKKAVSFLQNIVHDAERRSLRRRSREDYRIMRWLDDLKDAFYDAEDLLEEWKNEVMRPESPSKDEKLNQVITSFSPIKQPALRPEMSARARAIRERIEAIAAEGRDFDLRESAEDVRVGRGARNRERSDSFGHDEEEIIGREGAKSAIMKFLLDSDTEEKFSVLTMWGESGIGKTALARCLYEDDMVKKHFDSRIWVCVGDDSRNLETELQKIRGRETAKRADDMEQLQKYLLVIDGLWYVDSERWRSLKSLLMGRAQGSKILITTQHRSVVHLTGTNSSYYCLEALPENSSIDLLMRMACEEEEETRDSIKANCREADSKTMWWNPSGYTNNRKSIILQEICS